MPAFTAAASFLVAEFIGIGGAALLGSAGVAFVTSAVAVGLAAVTSRLINGSQQGGGGGGTVQDPGVRQQFPPATTNKLPIVYGTAYQKGSIVDARISNNNQKMTYLLALSEKTQTGSFSIGEIFWNDQKLLFSSDAGSEHVVTGSIDQGGDGSTNSNFANLIKVRVYAGSVNAADQIFPLQSTGNTVSAVTLLDEGDVKCPAGYELNGIVFAVIQVDYNSSKSLTGLGQVTFKITNTLKNPGLVWYDYLTSDRYGAGFPVEQINTTTSISTANTLSLYSFSETIPPNQYLAGGTTSSSQVRYEINGVISTGDTIKNNIDRICLSSACWNTFDFTEGKWKVILNRAATSSELTNAFVFDDDVIIGDVSVSATNLEDLYNNLEVEFASRIIRDQNDYFKAAIDPTSLNPLEPVNVMNMRLDMVNNALHAGRIGLIELKQSRADLIISFRADYSALQCQAGDVVKVTNSTYGFNEKLFRITKIREVEDEQGGITVEVTALQYQATIYTDELLEDSSAVPGSGIPVFGGSGSLPAPSAPVISNVNTGTNAYFDISSTIDPASGPVDEVQWFYSTSSSTGFIYLTNEISSTGNFTAGSTVTDTITVLNSGNYYFRARVGSNGVYGNLSTSSSRLVWTAGSLDFGYIGG